MPSKDSLLSIWGPVLLCKWTVPPKSRLSETVTHMKKLPNLPLFRLQICAYIYIYTVKAGGSPEWNYMLLKWNLKMFILHWFLQCFMALYQFIGALKVSDVARTNSEFVRAEKLYFNHLLTWTKILVSFFP